MKVKLKVSTYINGNLEKAGATVDVANDSKLVENGKAVLVSNVPSEPTVRTSALPESNEEILLHLGYEGDDVDLLVDELGDYQLKLKQNGELTSHSATRLNDIIDGDE